MSESNTAVTTELTSQYTAQVTSDLERNVKEQERINAEIVALQQQLTALQHDHTILVSMQQALGFTTSPAPAEPDTALGTAPDSAAVPAPRKQAPAESESESGSGKRKRAKKTEPVPSRAAAEKPAGKATAAKADQPTLVELVRRHLTEQGEPRSAAEVATALGEAHPDRGIKTTVVRTTLEGLVAKNQARRSKQGTSVFYTAPDASESTPQPEAAQAE